MSLTVGFLTGNEEPSIARAIASVTGTADEIFVADTGSTDQTAEIAQTNDARVIELKWDDGFPACRIMYSDRCRRIGSCS